ncbi:hypothetical protein [Plantactinospora sp. GCM10030261]|uniref:hypothetical protein n=1 Tax=Plantactinospora sp. GCM10030261 TaxID=3273420 RepID=UPI00360EB542
MAVLAISWPGGLTTGGSGYHSTSMYVSNPWGTTAVWLQCTTKYVAGDGQSEFGIKTVFQLNDAGALEIVNFGDNRFGTWGPAWFVPRLLAVTVAARTYDAAIEGTLTMFLWG